MERRHHGDKAGTGRPVRKPQEPSRGETLGWGAVRLQGCFEGEANRSCL